MSLNELILRLDPIMPRTVQLARMGNPRAIAALYEQARTSFDLSDVAVATALIASSCRGCGYPVAMRSQTPTCALGARCQCNGGRS